VERIVERPVYYDNIIERTVEVPVENIVYNKIITEVEEPVYEEEIIEKPVYIKKRVER
jgi:hypothetical protein